ncbi:MAG: 1,4-beta-xylanase [Myxococcota bacterium]
MSSVWSEQRAHDWQARRGWRVGSNFIPSSASNQLEMWQAPSFDLPTLERELDWARSLGWTSLRVFLHDLAWQQDPRGFGDRISRYLDAAGRRGLGTLFVLFDGVWDPHPRTGPQPEPRPRVHNSRWLQSPGAAALADPARQDALEPYVTGVLERFRDDPRVDGWDLFNEPDNPNLAYAAREIPDKAERAGELLARAFAWARAVDPSQPLTAGVWVGDWDDPAALSDVARLSLDSSDVISFHCYGRLAELETRVAALRRYGRPILCTEYLARTLGSTFDPHLGWMKEQGVGAYCWGFVAGRIQTEYGWDSWAREYDAEPSPWFHDVLRPDGTPYDPEEAAYIRSVT